MEEKTKYYLLKQKAVPEVLLKVAEAKKLIASEKAMTIQEATDQLGISRSSFYKYKDAVHPFNDMLHGRIVTFQAMLKDEPGILSGVLNIFAGTGMNVLTINQNIPVNGCAVVTVTAETSALQSSLEELLSKAGAAPGVIKCEILAG